MKNPGKKFHKGRVLTLECEVDAGHRGKDDQAYLEGALAEARYSVSEMKNPIPAKGTIRKFAGKIFYYMGRTIYHSKARLECLKLADLGIMCRVVPRRDVGWLIYADSNRVYLDLSEPLFNPQRNYVTTKGRPDKGTKPKSYIDKYGVFEKMYCPVCGKEAKPDLKTALIRDKTGKMIRVHNKCLAEYMKLNPMIISPPGYRYFDVRNTEAQARKLAVDIKKKGFSPIVRKGMKQWHVFVKGSKNPTKIKPIEPIADGITEEVRNRAWKKGFII